MFVSLAGPVSSVFRRTLLVVLLVATVNGCGGDDDTGPVDSPAATTTQNGGQGTEASDAGTGDASGGAGTATVTVSAGSFELQVEDESCVITDVAVGVVASSNEATLMLAGPDAETMMVSFELASGEFWSVALAEVAIDGSTMSYSGPAMGPDADSTISLVVFCDEVVTGPGG